MLPAERLCPCRHCQVRKQTCDLVAMLELAGPLAQNYFFMEDDFHSCGHMARGAAVTALKAAEWRVKKHSRMAALPVVRPNSRYL